MVRAEHCWRSNHALLPDNSHFDRDSILHLDDERTNAFLHEKRMLCLVAGADESFMHVQFDRRELRFQPPKFFLRQTQESAVGVRACARRFHFGAGGFPFVSLLSVVWTTLRIVLCATSICFSQACVCSIHNIRGGLQAAWEIRFLVYECVAAVPGMGSSTEQRV